MSSEQQNDETEVVRSVIKEQIVEKIVKSEKSDLEMKQSTKENLSVLETGFIFTLFSLLVSDIFQNGISTSSEFTKLFDFTDFTFGFRDRPSPNSEFNYNLRKHSTVDGTSIYILTSNVLLKFAGSILLKYVYFGIIAIPSITDLTLFMFLVCLAQFSDDDLLYNYFTQRKYFALVFNFGISIFKFRKLQSIVQSCISNEFSLSSSMIYTILAMEFVGITRTHEPILTHRILSKVTDPTSAFFQTKFMYWESFIHSIIFSNAFFYDTICCFYLHFVLTLESNLEERNTAVGFLLYAPLFCICFVRYEKKVFSKFSHVDVEQSILKGDLSFLKRITEEISQIKFFEDSDYNRPLDFIKNTGNNIFSFLSTVYTRTIGSKIPHNSIKKLKLQTDLFLKAQSVSLSAAEILEKVLDQPTSKAISWLVSLVLFFSCFSSSLVLRFAAVCFGVMFDFSLRDKNQDNNVIFRRGLLKYGSFIGLNLVLIGTELSLFYSKTGVSILGMVASGLLQAYFFDATLDSFGSASGAERIIYAATRSLSFRFPVFADVESKMRTFGVAADKHKAK
eukprot:snap_masked-scaffold_3-processed-gene-2.42-mRNA-1 protein AED:1.00 eAED:1.00 QI:0/-1/0/0/-1/1/1/0/562